MFLTHLPNPSDWCTILQTTNGSQTAVMNLTSGQATGEAKVAHEASDRVLVVLEGIVFAEVGNEHARMRPGDIVVIRAGVEHRFTNDTTQLARTVSAYAPPAYPGEAFA